MKPPSSNAEALRDQQAAQIRATNGLFVTADEFRHLECGQHVSRRFGSPSYRGAVSATSRTTFAVCAGSGYVMLGMLVLRTLAAPNVAFGARLLMNVSSR